MDTLSTDPSWLLVSPDPATAVPVRDLAEPRVAVLVPCFNESLTIERVVEGFRRALPRATIYVYDNNSSDDTATLATSAGAIVRIERRQGKGHVIRRMFADVEADCYILVDGDDTYDPSVAPSLDRHGQPRGLRLRQRRAGIVVVGRLSARPSPRQPRPHSAGPVVVRPGELGHAVGLQRHVATFREILSGHVRGFRNRNGTHGPRARNADAHGGDRGALSRKTVRLDEQIAHLSRRRTDRDADLPPREGRATAAVLRCPRSRGRMSRPAPGAACRP